MHHRRAFLAAFISLLTCWAVAASASPVRCFVPDKEWMVSINLPDFEPWPIPTEDTILGGETSKGLIITIIMEEVEPGSTSAQVREEYGVGYMPNTAEREEIETFELGDMAVISYPRGSSPHHWGFNGYVVKEDRVFDIHITSDLHANSKGDVRKMLESFKIEKTAEVKDTAELSERLEGAKDDKEADSLLSEFAKKYPNSPWVYWAWAERYFAAERIDKARDAFLKALANHKSQPFMNAILLWQCYDGLGMCYGMAEEYEESKKYLDQGYALAKDAEADEFIAASAYNLACWFAEKSRVDESVRFLNEAIQGDPTRRESAQTDSSFDKIRSEAAFQESILLKQTSDISGGQVGQLRAHTARTMR